MQRHFPGSSAASFAVLVALIASACGGPQSAPRPVNAIVVLVDTLRADHLGVYGYARATSPNIDRFARESIVFTQARAQAPCTHPSVASLLTALYPSRFRRFPIFGFAIPRRFPSIASILGQRGWQAAAVSASPIVRNKPSPQNPAGGYGVGFEPFREDCLNQDADCVNAEALHLLDTLREPFFLYLHYMEPHEPYRPPAGFERRFAGLREGPDFIVAGDPKPIAEKRYSNPPTSSVSEDDWRHLMDLYDDEIRFFDARFGNLLSALDDRGLSQSTVVALAADHGEEFAEHGDVMHCRNLHDVQIHTPLIVRVPGESAGRIDAPVGNVDLVPTLLDYLEVDTSGLRFDGRSLRGSRIDTPQSPAPVFGAWRGSGFVTDGGFKLIVDLASGGSRLYDLASDPGETRSVNAEHPAEAERLRGLLDAHHRALGADAPRSAEPDEKLMERLRKLGYLQ